MPETFIKATASSKTEGEIFCYYFSFGKKRERAAKGGRSNEKVSWKWWENSQRTCYSHWKRVKWET